VVNEFEAVLREAAAGRVPGAAEVVA